MGDSLDPTELDPSVVARFADEMHSELEKSRIEVTNRYWEDQTIHVDGYRFVNCRFDRCTITFTWPHFEFKGCVFEGCDFEPKPLAADPDPGLNKK